MAITKVRETSAEWAAGINDEMTAKAAVEHLQHAFDYSTDVINSVMSLLGGTTPPARDLMPELYAAREKVGTALSGMRVISERTPDAVVNKTYIEAGRKLGVALIDESNAALDRAKTSDSVPDVATALANAATNVVRKTLTPMQMILGGLLADHLLNGGRLRKSLFRG